MTLNLPWRKRLEQVASRKRAAISAGADKCVACGLCVPLCPTWQVSRNEADSPRGRIMLMARIGAGNSPANASHHLDACLGCARCEEACPNDVPYMDMLPKAKAVLCVRHTAFTRLVERLALSRQGDLVLAGMLAGAKLVRKLGLTKLLPTRLATAIPPAAHSAAMPPPPTASASNGQGTEVSLFTGCFSQVLHKPVLDAAIQLLTATGHKVRMPLQQTCCGAIAHHAGDLRGSERCANANRLAFATSTLIATIATGCAAQLAATKPPGKVVDAGLLVSNSLARLEFRPAPALTAIVHIPCSQRRLANDSGWVGKLLGHIPGLKIVPAMDDIACCGAGGLTHLEHPHTGTNLADRKIAAWQSQLGRQTVVLTTNPGCGWHLVNAAGRAGIKLRVAHPLELASEYLARNTGHA